ncbi:MmgE/PrpD family protein [Xylophilus sp. GOD-11R]|uniref:MmgE/PrpD family protein n=1 Tax=Xylophilus sp. GOD-11R TaxID=3089814 RepID=UPI00298C586B|nr:MmgE/PrpD family protein [Xylophilus sp. GOD-11R]WPB56410.1 MmgE/PrpD family protein [Xylophilus sp. GOD-11R]
MAQSLPEESLVAQLMERRAAPVPAATRKRLAQALLDWFTAGWSGLEMAGAEPMRRAALDVLTGPGSAPVFGAGSATALAAAFANAGIAHLREIDDAHRAAMLHPGVIAVSPVLALAAAMPLSQRRTIDAIVAGYEVSLRLGEALGAGHAARFHATATAGAVGAAAAAATALGLPAAQLHHAMGIAATQAAGLWQLVDDDAHEAKSLHPAFAVRNGLMAAFAARAGLPGARAFFSGRRGMYALLAGDGPMSAVAEALPAADQLTTATIKAWPCCAQIFTPLDATRALMDEHRIVLDDIERVEITIFAHALKIAGVAWPTKPAETAFCLRYVVATLLLKGRLGIAEMESPDLHDPALLALAAKIVVRTDDEFQKAFPTRRPARVEIVDHDGRTVGAYRELRRGDPEDPFDWQQLQQRMRAFAPAMDDAAAARVTDWCAGFADHTADARDCRIDPALFASTD